jgi:hypothetical protein
MLLIQIFIILSHIFSFILNSSLKGLAAVYKGGKKNIQLIKIHSNII